MAAERARALPTPRRRPQRSTEPKVAKPDLKVIGAPKVRTPTGRLVRVLAAVGATFAICLILVLVAQIAMLQRQDHLNTLRDRQDAQELEYQRLREEVAQLESPDVIVERAKTVLGMVDAPEVVYVNPAPAAEAEKFDRGRTPASSDNAVPDGTTSAASAASTPTTAQGAG